MRLNDYQPGDSGAGVTDLQNNLVSLGYPIGVDGSFGGETAAAVTHFQQAQGVTDDLPGVAGPSTLIAMSSALAASWTQSGFYYMASGSSHTAPAAKPSSSPAAPSAPMSKQTMALIGLAGLGVAWFVTSRK
jgi:peptidoglycan hydrolase-like protein with peptidoglycan-binding domain